MKIQGNTNWYSATKETSNATSVLDQTGKDKEKSTKEGSISATELNLVPHKDTSIKELLDQKAELSKKSEQMDIQAKLDLIKEKRAEDIAGYQEEIATNVEMRKSLKDSQDNLASMYEVEEGSPEANELELRRKVINAKRGGNLPTKEELAAHSALGEPSEYQQRMLEYDDMIQNFDDKNDELNKKLRMTLAEERDESLSQEDAEIIAKFQKLVNQEIKNIDKQINEKVVEAAGNVVDEKK